MPPNHPAHIEPHPWDSQSRTRLTNKLLWAACCLGFFAFLRSGEFTLKKGEQSDPTWHLSINNVAIDSLSHPTKLQIYIKASKTDQWRQGVYLIVGSTTSHVCPVKSLLTYIAIRGFKDGPLFINQNGTTFTQQSLVSSLRVTLSQVGIDCTHSGHSFRIEAATTASVKGVPETTVQALGRWSSDSYKCYIRLPHSELASISSQLIEE